MSIFPSAQGLLVLPLKFFEPSASPALRKCNCIFSFLHFQVASAMYIIGAVEILMTYIVGPQMSLFGPDISQASIKFNNFRVYGTFFVIGKNYLHLGAIHK